MDQDSFRKLLQTPHAGSSTGPRGSFVASSSSTTKHKTIDASQPAFKPRKVKKKDSQYRDRAAERRLGNGNDFAEVEAILETFEKSTAGNKDKAAVEYQRQYLGGDQAHTILVKGLDISLLEQNKARAAQATNGNDDELLEQAFKEVGPRKRTREDIVRELKAQRSGGVKEEEAKDVSKETPAKNANKFKPIGFKPIGAPAEGKKKKKKRDEEGRNEGERRKKKQKVESRDGDSAAAREEMLPHSLPAPTPEPEPEPIPDEFDIFPGARKYEGIDLGDDDDSDEDGEMEDLRSTQPPQDISTAPLPRGGWFNTDEDQPPKSPPSRAPSPPEEDSEPEQPTRLVPLSSSALPSIRDLLAADEAQDKNKKWMNKKKKGGKKKEVDSEEKKKVTAEAKAERDYKRLKSYQEKKGASGS